METGSIGPEIGKSALVIVDMQNDLCMVAVTSLIWLGNLV